LELGVRMHPEDALLIQENVEVTFFNTWWYNSCSVWKFYLRWCPGTLNTTWLFEFKLKSGFKRVCLLHYHRPFCPPSGVGGSNWICGSPGTLLAGLWCKQSRSAPQNCATIWPSFQTSGR
jgi:hypothetical protein